MNNVKLPQAVALELTYQCNHKCIFCSCPWYAPGNNYPVGKELDCEQWFKAIDILFENGVSGFSITGGETTLKDCMPQIVEYIHTNKLKRGYDLPTVLISNGMEMSDEFLKLFKRCNVHLSMSLPGYETFEQHTGTNHADGVLQWFKKLYYMNELMLNRTQLNEMLSTAEEILQLANREGSVGTEIPLCAVDNPEKYKNLSIGYLCSAANGFFVVDPSGNIRTCNHSPRIVGNIFSEPIIEDVRYWNMFAQSDYSPAMCSGCKMVRACDCGCREVANILHGSPREMDSSII